MSLNNIFGTTWNKKFAILLAITSKLQNSVLRAAKGGGGGGGGHPVVDSIDIYNRKALITAYITSAMQ